MTWCLITGGAVIALLVLREVYINGYMNGFEDGSSLTVRTLRRVKSMRNDNTQEQEQALFDERYGITSCPICEQTALHHTDRSDFCTNCGFKSVRTGGD